MDALVSIVDEQSLNPDESIKHWLAAQHLPTELPRPFNTDLLIFLGFEEVQGKKVPVIIFGGTAERGFAKVYLFEKDGGFNIDEKSLRDAQASTANAEKILGQGKAAGVVYVIVYTGHDIKPFLRVQASNAA
jgi:hypothetical protein